MKNNNDIEYIYEKLSSLYPNYSNKKPKAKIYSKAYTSLIGVMLSEAIEDKAENKKGFEMIENSFKSE